MYSKKYIHDVFREQMEMYVFLACWSLRQNRLCDDKLCSTNVHNVISLIVFQFAEAEKIFMFAFITNRSIKAFFSLSLSVRRYLFHCVQYEITLDY